jgi:adenosylcobinamide kinase/adenosylcobinamide-phosphate guanylyltransferase
MLNPQCAPLELIVGGQKSGKSRRAEALANSWLAQDPCHSAVLLATAQAQDAEMHARVARHQADRAKRALGLTVVEEPLHLPQSVAAHSNTRQLVVIDCMTLWLTNWMMPVGGAPVEPPVEALVHALRAASGPVVLVSNEIGLGVIPMGTQVRAFVDVLGHLNQALAATCDRVTFMVAGLPITLKHEK